MIRGLLWKSMRCGKLRPRRAKQGTDFNEPSWSWASLEYGAVFTLFSRNLNHGIPTCGRQAVTPGLKQRDYRYVEGMPLRALGDIDILSVQYSNIGASPFSQVQSGIIRLKGHIRQVAWIPSGKNLYDCTSHNRVGVLHLDEFRLPSYGRLVLTCCIW